MSRWVPRPVDVALAAVLTVAAQVELWVVPLGADGVRPLLAVGYLAATGAVAWHRRAPLTALAVTLVGAFVIPSAAHVDAAAGLVWLTATLVMIASAGYHAGRPLVALAETLLLLAVAVVLSKGLSPGDLLYAWLLSGGAWVAGRALGTRTLRAELSEQRARLAEREAQAAAAAAVAEERLRIARELHDIVSSGISGMTLQVSGVRRLLGDAQARERAVLETVEQLGRESLAEMQRMLGVLRAAQPPDAVPAPGRLASVDALLEPARAAGIAAELTVTGTVRPLPPGVDLAAYRIVQEAVTNVLKHAGATRLTCTVHHGPRAVELRVEDDGTGGAVAGSAGHGQAGMRERAALYGGSVQTGPRPGGGYLVSAVLPVAEGAPERTAVPRGRDVP